MSGLMNTGHVVFLSLFNAVYGQHLKDPFTMYKVFRRDCLTDVHLECDRFDFDWELTAKLVRQGSRPDRDTCELPFPVFFRRKEDHAPWRSIVVGSCVFQVPLHPSLPRPAVRSKRTYLAWR